MAFLKINSLWRQIGAFIALNILGFLVAGNLPQKNSEELFLNADNAQKFMRFVQIFGREEITFFTQNRSLSSNKDWRSDYLKISEVVDSRDGQSFDLSELIPNSGLFEVSIPDDQQRFYFYQELERKMPHLSFGGMSFTNAHLAGMSLQIQQILFPIMFGGIFLILLLMFRNLATSCYLFFSSLLGASWGLAAIKLLFGTASILTTLTPLVGFILTLANQFHIVFGMAVYPSNTEFLKRKLAPILIMMATTVIGFATLITSDLIVIRQFGMTTTLSLTLTWSVLLLIFIKMDSVTFVVPSMPWFQEIKRPNYSPLKGLLLIGLLMSAGVYALKTMPKLVEAVYFFSEAHPVRTGQQNIEGQLGGTPQMDLIVSKKDGGVLAWEDRIKLTNLEDQLASAGEKLGLHILSSNQLIKSINQRYSGENVLPPSEAAALVLQGKIPEILQKGLLQESAYRMSLVDRPWHEDERSLREAFLEKIISNFKFQHPELQVEISGLNHLLLKSQKSLVDTLVTSLLGSFLMIAILFGIFSRDLREIATFSVISLGTILGGMAVMKLLGFSLNVSSVMTLSIAIGLVDDSTIHLLYAERHGDSPQVIRQTCLLPMVLSQGMLLLCFLLLGIESFIPIRQFALGLVCMLTLGLMLDLFVLPLITRQK